MPHQTIRLEMGRLRREVAIVATVLGLTLIAAILLTGWLGDRRSCHRSNEVRAAVHAIHPNVRLRHLDCGRLLPGV